jgi:glycosyltransferase involved in cell wall biosynthesis
MRVLFASHYALPHLGGIEVAVDAVARVLAARGHDVCHVASRARRAGEEEGAEPDGYRVLRVPALNVQEERLGVPYPVFAPSLLPILRREVARADVVHAHGVLYQSAALALWLARVAPGRPVRAVTEHVGHVDYASPVLDAAQRAAFATIGRAAARSAEGIVVLNDKVEAEMRALAPGRLIARIHNGVDGGRYRPPEPGERERLRAALGWDERPRVLFVGRLVAKKGLDHALAAALAASGAWELVVVGPGEPPRGTPPGVELLGAVAPARAAELYRAADAFLLPSRGEGFPITAQEAMASGLPVVLADEPGYAPYVDGADGGVRLAPTDATALVAAVGAVLADPGAGSRAADHARRAFSWERAASEHEALWRRLGGGTGRRRLR